MRPGPGERWVFLDLDGTLTDPKLGITRSIQHALRKLGRAPPRADDLTWCIGPPLLESFTTLLGDKEEAAAALKLYRDRFSTVGLFENVLYDGIAEMLKVLRADGNRLCVATSKPVIFANRIVAHFGIGAWFDSVFGPDLDGRLSDKTALLGHVLRELGVDPSRCVMVGDRKHDVVGARNNAIPTIGVLYGYGSHEELIGAGAAGLCRQPAEIPAEVRKIRSQPGRFMVKISGTDA